MTVEEGRFRLGVDIGGTFTDIVLLHDDGRLYSKKVLSTPDDYSRAIQEGVEQLLAETGISAGALYEIGHGTTIATNAIIERRGAKVALITTRGFRDVLEIGRYRVPRLYDLHWRKPEPLVERRFRFEVTERMNCRGEILVPVRLEEVDDIVDALRAEHITSVAVCFLHAYANNEHERLVVERLRQRMPEASVSASAQLMPQIQEYERTSTTVVNAYLRPTTSHYVGALKNRLKELGVDAPLQIMQSCGAVLPADVAADNPVYIIESGPAAGVVGARKLSERNELGDVIVFDMGGTTAKASIVADGDFALTPETEVGGAAGLGGHRLIRGAGYIVQVPTVDIAEVGAGGGSIASIDPAGGLRVGPGSAGADPGPACYGRGGDQPTVTDANLLLGYLNDRALVGGELELDRRLADGAIGRLSERLERSPVEVAFGIHQIADSNMLRALKSVTVERGRDPADFAMVAIGGNGGVHGWGMAEELGIGRIVVPPVSGLFSAMGLLFVNAERESICSFYHQLSEGVLPQFNATLEKLMAETTGLLEADGYRTELRRELVLYAGMKYVGQIESLPVQLPRPPLDPEGLAALVERFGELHERTYGYQSPREPLQFVWLKCTGRGLGEKPRMPDRVIPGLERPRRQVSRRGVYFGPERGWRDTDVVARTELPAKGQVQGPLVIEEYDCTIVVPPGWQATRDDWSNVVVTRH